MALSDSAIPLDGWRDALKAGKPPDMLRFEDHVNAEHLPHAVILDCSASAEVAEQYPRWLGAGIHVVTPNKRANSGPLDLYDDLQEARRAAGSHYLYEATVGAGLPIIQTLRDLRETGDDIRRIEGILSGTLAYLFNVWDGKQPFSEIVRDAKAQRLHRARSARRPVGHGRGAQAHDSRPRDGAAARPLARSSSKGLIPASLGACNVDEFMEAAAGARRADAASGSRQRARKGQRASLRRPRSTRRRAARPSGSSSSIALHPFANINLTDNIVRFITSRYDRNPLVVQGPGAGPAVTAGGVFADLLRVCAYLGAKL